VLSNKKVLHARVVFVTFVKENKKEKKLIGVVVVFFLKLTFQGATQKKI